MDVPFAKWKWSCPFKDEIPGLDCVRQLEKAFILCKHQCPCESATKLPVFPKIHLCCYLKKPTQAQFCIACLQAQCVYTKKTVLSYLHGKLIFKTCLLYFIYIFFICFCKIARNCSFFIGKCGSRGLSRDFYDMRKMKPQCINW